MVNKFYVFIYCLFDFLLNICVYQYLCGLCIVWLYSCISWIDDIYIEIDKAQTQISICEMEFVTCYWNIYFYLRFPIHFFFVGFYSLSSISEECRPRTNFINVFVH